MIAKKGTIKNETAVKTGLRIIMKDNEPNIMKKLLTDTSNPD
jgi:hypothetical protein